MRFLTFYLGCGLVAALAHAVADPHSTLPAIGASGAIAGILGTYLVLFPRAHVQTLIFLGIFVHLARIPALILLPIWFLLQLFSGLAALAATPTAGAAGGVAWFAHVGGFLAGPIVYFLVRRR